nr:uncharacterized protein LOC117833256 [Setaria viridis]
MTISPPSSRRTPRPVPMPPLHPLLRSSASCARACWQATRRRRCCQRPCAGPQGDVVLTLQKPVVGFVPGRDGDAELLLEAMALVEGLHAALGLGITTVNVITHHGCCTTS